MKTRILNLKNIIIKNILVESAKIFATEEEKKEYKFFNIKKEKCFEVKFEVNRGNNECYNCDASLEDEWSYCPFCAEEINDYSEQIILVLEDTKEKVIEYLIENKHIKDSKQIKYFKEKTEYFLIMDNNKLKHEYEKNKEE